MIADWMPSGFVWSALACFGLTVVSAVFPWMNAEIIVLALPAVAPSRGALFALVLVASAGQMAGKCLVYWIGRGAWHRATPRMTAAGERWRARLTRRLSSMMGLVFFSSAVGLPPFFALTAVAGALRVNFPGFLIAGTAGRLVRFGALAFVPQFIASWMR